MIALKLAGLAYLYLNVTWLIFLAIMALKSAYTANLFPKWGVTFWVAVPWLLIGLVLDAGLNLAMSLPLLDLPREPLFTGKCERLIAEGAPWKANFCLWVCRHFLDPFQANGHCKKYKP